MNRAAVIIFSLIIIFLSHSLNAQTKHNKLDFERITDKHIERAFSDVTDESYFNHLNPICYDSIKNLDFRVHTKSYFVESAPDSVFQAYILANPAKVYNGKIISFGFLYSKDEEKVIYADDPNNTIKEGQIVFNHLSLLRGLKNLVVGYEVTLVDAEELILQFCYVNGGITEGSQTLSFSETKNGFTRIDHLTNYKSDSGFRDKVLYPKFHTITINEFHQNIKEFMEGQ